MSVDRITVTVDEELGDEVRAAARERGVSVSAWLSGAARDRLRNENLRSALDEWSVEAGEIDETSVAEAAAVLEDRPA